MKKISKLNLSLGVSLISLTAVGAFAQDAAPPADGAQQPVEVVITGIRASLKSSEAIKRKADQIVDAVSAEDVGKFPDANIAESLQRITGVSISRNGGEGQFITVRGLGPEYNTVLVNGRVMATDNDGREFSFDTLSSTLIQRATVYKTSTADLQEGGIGATVDIVTARPLDQKKGFHFAGTFGGFDESQRSKTTPEGSGTVSWLNDNRTFGAVLSASYSDRNSVTDSLTTEGWAGQQVTLAGTGDSTDLTTDALGTTTAATVRSYDFARIYQENKRTNFGGAVQWKPADNIVWTIDGVYSKYDNDQDTAWYNVYNYGAVMGLQTNDNNTAIGWVHPGTDFVAANPALGSDIKGQETDNVLNPDFRHTQSYQLGTNLKWTVNDQLKLNFDLSTTQAKKNETAYFFVSYAQSSSNITYNLNPGDDVPTITGIGPESSDPSAQYFGYTSKSLNKVNDQGTELHIDGEFTPANDSFVKSIKFGLYGSRREKSKLAYDNTTADGYERACAYCSSSVVQADPSIYTQRSLDNYLDGASGSSTVQPFILVADLSKLEANMNDRDNLIAGLMATNGWTADKAGTEADKILASGGIWGMGENIGAGFKVREDVWATYLTTNWSFENIKLNFGARIVNTNTLSSGLDAPLTGVHLSGGGTDALAFDLGPATIVSVSNHYTDILPSANMSYKLTDDMDLRLAVSKTVTRPTLTSLGTNNSYGGRATDAYSSGGNPNLKPYESTNYDASYEWYLNPVSYISAAVFYKKLTNFAETDTTTVTRFGYDFQDTRIRNALNGSLVGLELAAQYSFDKLPGIWSGLGAAANLTHIEDEADYIDTTNNCQGIPGDSPNSYNVSLFYEKYGVSLRGSYNWRQKYLMTCSGQDSKPQYQDSYGQVDFSASYDINPTFQIFFQGVNLTNNVLRSYNTYEERLVGVSTSGTRYIFGGRVKY
jgi:iron complex outermembrane receptor protein